MLFNVLAMKNIAYKDRIEQSNGSETETRRDSMCVILCQ